ADLGRAWRSSSLTCFVLFVRRGARRSARVRSKPPVRRRTSHVVTLRARPSTSRCTGWLGRLSPTRPPNRGRNALLTIGVDVGGTGLRASVVDADGAVRTPRRVAAPDTRAELKAVLTRTIGELAPEHSPAAVGLAVAGFVSEDRRVVQ